MWDCTDLSGCGPLPKERFQMSLRIKADVVPCSKSFLNFFFYSHQFRAEHCAYIAWLLLRNYPSPFACHDLLSNEGKMT